MRRLTVWIVLSLGLCGGCTQTAETPVAGPDKSAVTGQAGEAGTGGSIQVQTGGAGAGGAAPVTGGENLGSGSGGGVGNAAKDAAHKAAEKASGAPPPAEGD